MKKLLLVIALSAFGQGFKFNPFTGQLDMVGSPSPSSGYNATVTSQTTLTVTAATHGQGTKPIAGCFDNSSPALSVACTYTRNTSGDVVFSWAPAFTGTVNIWAGGGTSGISGASNLTTVGAVPYVSSSGVLNQAPTGLFYDSANVRLGVGTETPGAPLHIVGAIDQEQLIVNSPAGAIVDIQTWRVNNAVVADITSTGAIELTGSAGVAFEINGGRGTISEPLAGSMTFDSGNLSNGNQVFNAATTGRHYWQYGGTTKRYFDTNGIWFNNNQTLYWKDSGAVDREILRGQSDNYTGLVSLGNGIKFWSRGFGTSRVLLTDGGNLAIGNSPTDGNYKLDIQASDSTGTLRVFDQGGAGTTLAVIQAGAGQSGNLLSVRNNAGTEKANISATGGITGDFISSISYVTSATSSYLGVTSRLGISSPSDGVATIQNWAGTDFSSLQFGGTTSSFPALRRTNAEIDVVLADNSAWAVLHAGRVRTEPGLVSGLPAAGITNTGSIACITDANATTIGSTVAGGGSNKVLVWSDGTNWKIYAN